MKKTLTITEGDTKYLDENRKVKIVSVTRHSQGGAPAQNVVEVEIEEPDFEVAEDSEAEPELDAPSAAEDPTDVE